MNGGFEYVFSQLGFLVRGYLRHLGLTQGLKREFSEAIEQTAAHNDRFALSLIRDTLDAIAVEMLAPRALRQLAAAYPPHGGAPKDVEIVMTGGAPLEGFHDVLRTLAAGDNAAVRLSPQDPFLLPMLARQTANIDYTFEQRIILTPKSPKGEFAAVPLTSPL
jgi:hypothetical protein